MITKYNIEVKDEVINKSLNRIVNQTYKLLPMREEGSDWHKPLETILEEISGMSRILGYKEEIFFSLVCKLEGLFKLTSEEDFQLYRRTIFECLGLLNLLVIRDERA